jgi:hypothetical protein
MDRVLVAALVIALAAAAAALYRARRQRPIDQVEPADFGLSGRGRAVAGFTSPMCHSCQLWRTELAEHGLPAAFVDVKERPELARRYHVHATPAVLLVDLASGRVLRQFREDPHPAALAELRELMTS